MCVNDLVVQGAEPLFFLDYFATGKLDVGVADVGDRKASPRACKEAGCALIGGETAEMPGLYAQGRFRPRGICRRRGGARAHRSRDKDIETGDVMIGVASSGVHSNGFSLVRRVVEQSGLALMRTRRRSPGAKRSARHFCTPTRSMSGSCLEAIADRRRERPRAHHRRRHHREPAARPARRPDAEIDLRPSRLPPSSSGCARGAARGKPRCCAPSTAASA